MSDFVVFPSVAGAKLTNHGAKTGLPDLDWKYLGDLLFSRVSNATHLFTDEP